MRDGRKTMSRAAWILLAAISSTGCGGATAGGTAGRATAPTGHAADAAAPAGHAAAPTGHAADAAAPAGHAVAPAEHATAPAGHHHGHRHAQGRPGAEAPDDALRAVAAIHGGAGPWAVAGYRMGRYALTKLGLPEKSFDLEVVHHSPRSVQFSCIADGAAAATGASLGKLNLSLVEATEAGVETTYRRRSTGQTVTLRPSAAFRARFRDVPREGLAAAGKEVLSLPDAEVFEEVPPPPAGAPR